jgi:hypothetical protein
MNIGIYLNAMRDPAGLPSPAIIFDFFLVLTFALHILLVNLVIGSALLILYGRFSSNPNAKLLSQSLSRLLVNSLSWAIVLGVAPLLFVQVIYDPFWYIANTISAWWALGFLAFIALAFILAYVFYLGGGYEGKSTPLWIILSLAFLFLAGIVMHSLAVAQLVPEKWASFVVKDSKYLSSGSSLHAFELFRFLHFMVPALAVIGVWLIFYGNYFKSSGKYSEEYLNWVKQFGAKLALYFSLIQAVVGFIWLITIPSEFKFYTNPFFILALISALIFLALLFKAQSSSSQYAKPIAGLLILTVLLMSAAREALRMAYFAKAGYSMANYPVNPSYGSLLLFLATFVMGVIVLLYTAIVVYRSGKGIKEVGYEGLGKVSVYLMWAWIVVMVVIGVVIAVKNGALF